MTGIGGLLAIFVLCTPACSMMIPNYINIAGFSPNFDAPPYDQSDDQQYNLLYHGGGLGPFIPHPGYGIDQDPPMGHYVDQVHLILRHGERYPSTNDGKAQRLMIDDLHKVKITDNKGALAFLKDYKYFATDSDFEQLSTHGPYSGASDAFHQGKAFERSYGHLYDNKAEFPVFAASDKRVVDTAINFAKGFLGEKDSDKAAIQVIPETRLQGANTLAPSTFCKTYNRGLNNGKIESFPKTYLQEALKRLEKSSPAYKGKLSENYMFLMMTMCLFELNTVGKSKFCNLFTRNEWLNFAYYRDLTFYYQSSFGHPKSLGIGSNYVNATLNLLESDHLDQKIFPSFTHDTDMTPVLVPLGLFQDHGHLPTSYLRFNSLFKSSQIVPMGLRIVIERLSASKSSPKYIRIKVGGSVIPITGCTDGPGFSCPLDSFSEKIRKNLNGVTYLNTCETDKDLPQHLSFFWDWRDKHYN